MPPEVPARAGVWRVWWASWGRLSGLGLSAPAPPSRSPGLLLVGVFGGVRLWRWGIPGNVLLSKIYVLACSEPSLQPFSNKNNNTFYGLQQLLNPIRVGRISLLNSDS